MESYTLLDQQQEDALHAGRLLSTEDRTFKRLHRKIMGPNSLVAAPNVPRKVVVAKESNGEDPDADKADENMDVRASWKQEVAMDFTAFEANIMRTQLLLDGNARERERYAAEKDHVLATAQKVRANNEQLRSGLADAQATLALRKTYDKHSEKITKEGALKSCTEQRANIQKLYEGIAELERESEEYAKTWVERREQFGKIVDEGTHLLRLIRDEKEEAERKEGIDGDDEAEGTSSNAPTPQPMGDSTPLHPGTDGELSRADSRHGPTSKLASGANTPAVRPDETMTDVPEEGEDVEVLDTT